jgi:hypothetical protein
MPKPGLRDEFASCRVSGNTTSFPPQPREVFGLPLLTAFALRLKLVASAAQSSEQSRLELGNQENAG